MPRILGERIMIREYQKEDLNRVREWVNDPETVRNLDDIFLYPHTLAMTERFINAVLEDEYPDTKNFVIADINTEAYIGQISLTHIDWHNRKAEMAIVIGRSEDRNKGYGKEAVRLLLGFAFRQMNLHRIELRVREFNTYGYNCYLKCGFKEEGRKRQDCFIDGGYVDTIVMGILSEEF